MTEVARHLACRCGVFQPDPERGNLCRRCDEALPFFRPGEEPPTCDGTASDANPTPSDLVWGTREDGTGSIGMRLAALRYLTRAAAPRHAVGADLAGGAGRCLTSLARPFSLFLHLDLSWEALRHAAKRHPDLAHVVYGRHDLLGDRPLARDVDVAYAVDTLLYPGDFVPRALAHARATLRDDGVLIAEFPTRLRSSIARRAKGARWRGPRETFSREEAREVSTLAGFDVAAEFQLFKECGFAGSRVLERVGLARRLAGLSTWFYLVLRKTR